MIEEVKAKSILLKHKKIDSWFITHYGMNLYRGCTHNCAYCDGRNEQYNTGENFGRDVEVKINAPEILDRELDPERRRKPLPRSFVVLGGGVCDAYQPVEEKYELTRKTLKLLYKYRYPVHILTKSVMVKRDLDIIKKIDRQEKALVSFSISSCDDGISSIFESGVPGPSERLDMIRKIKEEGISSGVFLMPVIPFITDTPEMIEKTVKKIKESGADFIIFGSMTLKTGRQKEHFFKVLKKKYPGLVKKYQNIYPDADKWGAPDNKYMVSASSVFDKAAALYGMPRRIPPDIYKNVIGRDDHVIVILEHLDYLLKLRGRKSPYGYAAYMLSKQPGPISEIPASKLLGIKGIGPVTVNIIGEIIDTGRCKYYEKLI